MTRNPLLILLVAYAVVLLVGVVAGCRQRITVFADLGDLLVTFSIVAGTYGGVILLLGWDGMDARAKAACILAGILVAIAAVCRRSWKQNGTVPATALAVLTKLPFAVAVPLLVLQVVAPSGRTASDRANGRASALLMLTIVAPLLIALVRDKQGLRRYLGVA